MSHEGGPPAPGKPRSPGERLGVIAALIILFTILAGIAGFASDLIVWGWDLGRGIIH